MSALDDTAERWLAEYAAMAESPLPSPAAVAKALISDLCDALETIDPAALVANCDEVELLGVHGDAEMASAWLGAVATLAGAAIKRGAKP